MNKGHKEHKEHKDKWYHKIYKPKDKKEKEVEKHEEQKHEEPKTEETKPAEIVKQSVSNDDSMFKMFVGATAWAIGIGVFAYAVYIIFIQ
jgi:hypothetical protein